jgi:hypothetical protein
MVSRQWNFSWLAGELVGDKARALAVVKMRRKQGAGVDCTSERTNKTSIYSSEGQLIVVIRRIVEIVYPELEADPGQIQQTKFDRG